MSITSIQLTVGEDIWDGFIFVGDSSSDNGMTNPACAMVSCPSVRGVAAPRLALVLLLSALCVCGGGALLPEPGPSSPSAAAIHMSPCPSTRFPART